MIDTSTWEAHGTAWVVCPQCRRTWPKGHPEHDCRVPYALVDALEQENIRLGESNVDLIAREAQAQVALREHEASFDLRWNADQRAIKQWQAAHPGNDLVWPDHADLCVWLMEKLQLAHDVLGATRLLWGGLELFKDPVVSLEATTAIELIDRVLEPCSTMS